MVGPNGGYFKNAPVFYKTGTGIYAEVSPTDSGVIADEGAEFTYTFDPFADCGFTCRVTIDEDAKAKLYGFKNANCMSRFVRRVKREKERERRRRLKEGSSHA